MTRLGVACAIASCAVGCTTESFHAPSVARIVNKSLPDSLQPGATAPVARSAPTASPDALAALGAKYIRNLFQNTYTSHKSALIVGYLNAQIGMVDGRFADIEEKGGSGDCLSAAPVSFTADLTTIDPVATVTLPHLQCKSAFGDNSRGSGVVFGGDGANNSSLWIGVGQPTGDFTTTGGFLNYANVQNEGSTSIDAPETVDALAVEYLPQNDHGAVIRYKANATAQTFELFLANNGGGLPGYGPSDGDAWLGGGFRMISDGTRIYADGVLWAPSDAVSGWQPFSACITASTLAVDPTAGDCAALASSFTLGATASLNYCELVGAGPGCTIPLPAAQGQAMPVAPSVVAAVEAIFPITAAPPGVGSY